MIANYLDAGTTERVFELFRRGALTDERLVELYHRNSHYFVSWPDLVDTMILKHRQKLSNDLRLTSIIERGVHKYAITENLAAVK